MTKFSFFIGSIAGIVTTILGGWDAGLQTLLIFMVIDFISGVLSAAVFHKSKKTPSGTLSSAEMLRGLVKKIGELVLVVVAVRLDILTGLVYIRDMTVIALCVDECLSILENLGKCGVPIPKIIRDALDTLQNNKDVDLEDGLPWKGEEDGSL